MAFTSTNSDLSLLPQRPISPTLNDEHVEPESPSAWGSRRRGSGNCSGASALRGGASGSRRGFGGSSAKRGGPTRGGGVSRRRGAAGGASESERESEESEGFVSESGSGSEQEDSSESDTPSDNESANSTNSNSDDEDGEESSNTETEDTPTASDEADTENGAEAAEGRDRGERQRTAAHTDPKGAAAGRPRPQEEAGSGKNGAVSGGDSQGEGGRGGHRAQDAQEGVSVSSSFQKTTAVEQGDGQGQALPQSAGDAAAAGGAKGATRHPWERGQQQRATGFAQRSDAEAWEKARRDADEEAAFDAVTGRQQNQNRQQQQQQKSGNTRAGVGSAGSSEVSTAAGSRVSSRTASRSTTGGALASMENAVAAAVAAVGSNGSSKSTPLFAPRPPLAPAPTAPSVRAEQRSKTTALATAVVAPTASKTSASGSTTSSPTKRRRGKTSKSKSRQANGQKGDRDRDGAGADGHGQHQQDDGNGKPKKRKVNQLSNRVMYFLETKYPVMKEALSICQQESTVFLAAQRAAEREAKERAEREAKEAEAAAAATAAAVRKAFAAQNSRDSQGEGDEDEDPKEKFRRAVAQTIGLPDLSLKTELPSVLANAGPTPWHAHPFVHVKNKTNEFFADLIWTDQSISADRLQRLHPYQKINHFVGMSAITRKGNLGRNLLRMKRKFPTEYRFFPDTWVLPTDLSDFRAQFDGRGSGCGGPSGEAGSSSSSSSSQLGMERNNALARSEREESKNSTSTPGTFII